MLESGPLSEDSFAAFAAEVVPFCHITSRVPSDKDQNLLPQKGGSAFPYLAFLDASGRVLMVQGERSVEAFRASLSRLEGWRKLKARFEGGDASAANELLITELRLHLVPFEEAQARSKDLENLTDDEKKEIAALLVDAEFDAIRKSVRSREDLVRADARLVEMYRAARVPTGDLRRDYYAALLRVAQNTEDVAMFEDSLTALRQIFGKDARFTETLEFLDGKLKQLRAQKEAQKPAKKKKDGDG